MRVVGSDAYATKIAHNSTFTDGDGNERLQVIYGLQGTKGEARVDVEMIKNNKEWEYQYIIVSTKFATIPVVDNRPLYAR